MNDEFNQNAETDALSNDDLGDVTGGAAPKEISVAAAATSAGKGGTNPLHHATQATEPSTELPESDLDNVAGGNVPMHDFNFGKKVDKASA